MVAFFLVSVITFAMTEMLPGDMALRVAAARYNNERVTSAMTENVRLELGLDKPGWLRFGHWAKAMLSGNLGLSVVTGRTVSATLEAPLRRSLLLVAISWPAGVILGVGLGSLFGWTTSGVAVANALGAFAAGTPSYVLGLALGTIFSINLRWLPIAGYGDAAHLVLPAATLALLGGLRLALVTARETNVAYRHPSIAFARMKAVSGIKILVLHILPLAAPAIVAYAFVTLAFLLEGAAVIETVFAYPGLGRLLVDTIQTRDVPVIQAAAVFIAIAVVAANSVSDLIAAWLNRRIGRG